MNFNPQFYDHEVVQKSPQDYSEIVVSPTHILKCWETSMFACEVLDKQGNIKQQDDMEPSTLKRYIDCLEIIKRGEETPKPILGYGIMDNIEIGVGREIVLAAKTLDINEIPVNIRKAQAEDIQKILK
jgi:hypothetical protein